MGISVDSKNIKNSTDCERWKAWFDTWGIKYREDDGDQWTPNQTSLVFDANYFDAAEVVFNKGKFEGIYCRY